MENSTAEVNFEEEFTAILTLLSEGRYLAADRRVHKLSPEDLLKLRNHFEDSESGLWGQFRHRVSEVRELLGGSFAVYTPEEDELTLKSERAAAINARASIQEGVIVPDSYVAVREKISSTWSDYVPSENSEGSLKSLAAEATEDSVAAHESLHPSESAELSGWKFGSKVKDVTTYYRVEEDGLLSIRTEGFLDDLPLFEQCAVVNEVDLFQSWVPFCHTSQLITKLNLAELILYADLSVLNIGRDFAMRAYAADCLSETGRLIVIGSSIDELPPNVEGSIPYVTSGWFHDRMDVKRFAVIVEVVTPTSARACIEVTLNPRMTLPRRLLNFIMKNVAGMMLVLFQKQVRRVKSDPTCDHAIRIKNNTEFYHDWLLPRFAELCYSRGWELPSMPYFS